MADPIRVAFVSLGCVKNLVDSEKMLGLLAEAGCVITADEADADAIVINTCGFLDAARIEADEVIREAVARKAQGIVKRVVVAGCLVQRDEQAILERVPGVDALVGVHRRDDIVRAVCPSKSEPRTSARAVPLNPEPRASARATADGAKRRTPSDPATSGAAATKHSPTTEPTARTDLFLSDYQPYTQIDTGRLRLTPRHYAFLRISEGCDQKCTFCTIPAIRGRMHCKPPDLVVAEARELVSDGAVELHLIGQDTTSYGIGEERFDGGLASLLRRLNDIDGLSWIRLMYVYPSVLTDDILDAMADCERVCKYIDIPLQHINDRILKAMHRRIDRGDTLRLLERIRERIPGVTIRTTMIAGFPGETDAEFAELVDFVRDFRFDALGVFAFSAEPDTPAGRMKRQLPAETVEGRVDALMRVQQKVAFGRADAWVGRVYDVLVDSVAGPDVVVARHEGQAPSVDSVTYVERCTARPGDLVRVRCVRRRDYDLVATPTSVALPVVDA